jgi:hypothetical protein
MRHLLVVTALISFGGLADAQVLRCVDAAGNTSYGDTACPKGARQSALDLMPEPAARGSEPQVDRRQEQIDGANRARQLQRESVDTVTRQPQAPAGPVILDTRPSERPAATADDRVWSQDADPYASPYPYARPAAPPRDMRPRLRNCNAAGCDDRQGNHYDRGGKLDRYTTPDGRNCRPVGTTVVCN